MYLTTMWEMWQGATVVVGHQIITSRYAAKQKDNELMSYS